ncbi:MAG: SO_0444 family Cu/Zn efflux transporter [Desulfohalobiaceae bacterium]|nr:SO_0444 family Cu/Zn efflux transporter [Desulfohalobiaceae bacterium]
MASYFLTFSDNFLDLLLESGVYMLFGLLVSGLLRVFLSPGSVARHLGQGRFFSVFKAALLGVPIPLCSCGVLPAGAGLKKQGANNGAVSAFLISTPESGVDSISITYALLDPLMTVIRPVVAFVTAMAAGITENLFGNPKNREEIVPDLSCPVDGCCDGRQCPPEEHKRHHSLFEKVKAGLTFAMTEVWGDLVALFFLGLILAGLITAFIPEDVIGTFLGGGLSSMLIMLAVGIPLYICATASTPVAAALILKGVSPGAALVFLIAGPATNLTSLTVLLGILGRRGTAIYLAAIVLAAILFGLFTDQLYAWLGVSAQVMAGQAGEIVPMWGKWMGAGLLVVISVKPLSRRLLALVKRRNICCDEEHGHEMDAGCQPEQSETQDGLCASPG